MEKFVLVDGNSLVNRAFYGLPPMRSLSGKPCNAIYGFVNMMLSVIGSERPKYLVCVFDAGKHTFRHDIYPEYKGTRDKAPEDLISQITDLKELLKAMGILVVERIEIEADDIIGSFTRKFKEDFILLSGDKDLLQLINDNTTVWLTKKGISDVLKVTESVLMSEFGWKPYQVIEMKSIMGDSSDNIPGIPGIGKVGAQKLIETYDNLDNIIAHVDELSKGMQDKINNNKHLAYLSKQLATIKLDVDLPYTLENCEYHLPFNAESYEIMKDLGFKSILSRKEFFNYQPEEKVETINLTAQTIELESAEMIDEMISSFGDTLAVNIDNMSMIFSNGEKEFILYTSGEIFHNNIDKIRALFSSEKQKICFDAKSIMHELSHFDIAINNYFDVSLAIYVANELDAEINIDDALKLNDIITESKTLALFKLKEIYISKLINGMQLKLFSDIELPLVEVLFDMEKVGMSIDADEIKNLSKIYHEELAQLTNKIYELAGEEFNINSPKQLQNLLFNKLNIEYKGKQSTSIEVLNSIADKHEIVSFIIRYRKVAKLISTYLDGMLAYVRDDGKIHTTYMQRTTSTGRLSSREPNMQNLPIRDDEGKVLRKMFKSSFDNGTIISADYNQIELRLMANFSGDENMIEDYLSGKDIHTATASKIFGVPIDEVTSNMRRTAKSVNFGIIYGISAYGLSQNINSSVKEASEFIAKYLSIYPRVKEYGEECIISAREKGYAKTIMGRVRHILDINSRNQVMRGFAERVAKNMPLQGSASDIIKIAMIKVYNRMNNENIKSKLILQIHDELVVDCYPGESEIVSRILKEEMESVVDLKVPLLVEVSEGKTLYDAK
ncbi:MAG: DNA polymerase I [Clostridia bacterium]